MNIMWLIVPLIIGLAHPVILQMSVRVSRTTGDMESAVILHVIGSIVGLGWIAMGLRGGGFSGLSAVPWWAYLAGAIGVTCLAVTNRAIPVIGVATFCSLAVASQLIAALLFDRFGFMGAEVRDVTTTHWLGVGFLSLGAFLVSK